MVDYVGFASSANEFNRVDWFFLFSTSGYSHLWRGFVFSPCGVPVVGEVRRDLTRRGDAFLLTFRLFAVLIFDRLFAVRYSLALIRL